MNKLYIKQNLFKMVLKSRKLKMHKLVKYKKLANPHEVDWVKSQRSLRDVQPRKFERNRNRRCRTADV